MRLFPVFLPFSRVLCAGLLCFALNLFGCGGAASSSGGSSPSTAPALSLSASSFTFASTAVSSSSAAQTLTLSNTGTASFAFSAVTLSDTTNYALTNNCTGFLAPSNVCTMVLTFTPKSPGAPTATLSISGNASPATQTVSLSGTTPATAVLSAATITFPSTVVNTTSAAGSVTLTNTGGAALTLASIVLGGTGAARFAQTTTCGSTLAAGASCTISATFTPAAAQTYTATITVTDSAANSPQTVTLSGTGAAAAIPALTISPSSLSFFSAIGVASATQTITLTNSGSATLTGPVMFLGGANPTAFNQTSTCGASLAAGASCTLTVSFTPAAAQSYTATITLTDNAPNSPQTITLSGTGTNAAVTRTLYTFPQPDNSVTPLYALVNNATKTIDMTMYELQDTTFDNDLIAACSRGVRVRVILSASEKTNNTPAYTALNTAGTNCSAVYSNTAFTNTHQKTITVDSATTAILSLNLQSQYYSTTRDFALVENDPADIAAIAATFNADYAAGTPYGGTQGASDFSYQPPLGTDLIWSPTTAQAAMESLINNAKSTLLIENEELANSASYIVNDMVAACQRGVVLHLTMVNQSSYQANFKTLENAGCGVHVYPDTTTGFYVHAKVVVADYGLSTQKVYMGSINYSNASMNLNRELGLYITENAAVQTLYTTLTADYNGGTAY